MHPVSSTLALDARACADVADGVLQLADHWIQRSPVDFYTLGAASYLDGPWDQACYQRRRQTCNPVLAQSFAPLYQSLLAIVAEVLGEARFHPDLALPGFHVFAAKPGCDLLPGSAAFAAGGGSIHQDLQYTFHQTFWRQFGRVEWDVPLSFTLPVALPAAGGGLNLWPGLDASQGRPAVPPERLAYQLGTLYWFCQPLLHQIAPLQQATAGDRRITLQGHGLRCDGVWILYF